MNRVFIEGVDCSGKTTFVQDSQNYPDYPRLYPNDFKIDNVSWEVTWLGINNNPLFRNENLLCDRSFLSIYVYSNIPMELFCRYVDNNNLLRPDDEFKLIDIDYMRYLSYAETKGKKDAFDCLGIDEFLRLKKRYWEILMSDMFYRNFSLLHYSY